MSLSCVQPSDGQAGTYQSNYSSHTYAGYPAPAAYNMIFAFDDTTVSPGVQARYRVVRHDGVEVYAGPWHAPDATKRMQTLDLWAALGGAPGEYLVQPETQGYAGAIFATVVHFGGANASHLWLPANSIDSMEHYAQARGTARLQTPPAPSWPVTSPAAARVPVPYATVKGPADLWNTRRFNQQIKSAHRLKETLVRVGAGSVVGVGLQPVLTAWADFMKYQSGNRRDVMVPLVDGPRAVAHRGWTMATRLWPDGAGEYSLDLEGRLWSATAAGDVATIAGWRSRADVFPPDWKTNSQTFGGPAYLYHPDWFFSHYETVGTFTALVPSTGPDPKPRQRLWYDLAVDWGATRAADAFYICDVDRHSILRVLGGVVTQYAGNDDWTPGDLNCPKSCDLGPDGKLYVLNSPWYKALSATGAAPCSLVRLDLATGQTDLGADIASLGVTDRLRVRASNGRLVLTSQSLGQLWEVDFATGPVRKIGTLPAASRSAIAIDQRGECGPEGDIFVVQPLAGMQRRYGWDGTSRGQFFGASGDLASGPLNGQLPPAYLDTIDVGGGVIVTHDEGSEHSYWLTATQPSDPVCDVAAYTAGVNVWRHTLATMPDTGAVCSLAKVYGQYGCGTFGGPYATGSWSALAQLTDAGIIAWGVQHGLTEAQATALIYPIRWEHPSPPPGGGDTEAPDVPTDITTTAEWVEA